MLNLKLKAISELISSDDIVLDTCTDHAYLPIYLKKNNLCEEVYASDISESALNNAKENIKKQNLDIKTFLSDGFKNIPVNNINTTIIAGVGTSTVIKIIDNAPNNIIKYIISSNNNYEELRQYMLKKKFYIKKELIVKENNKFYPIMLFTKEKTKETKFTLKYGKSNNQEYFNYLITKEENILKNIPSKYILKRLVIKHNIKLLLKAQK